MAGRPRAPRVICNNVLPHINLQMSDVIPRDIYQEMADDMSWITWLAEHRLIRNESQCAVCLQAMPLTRRQNRGIGYDWTCQRCNTRTSLKTGSFFANTRLDTRTIVMLMYYWVYSVKCSHVMLFENITDWHIIVDYNNFFRVECQKWINQRQVQLGGFDVNGQPVVVEVDESYFFHRKYHRGRRRNGSWVFGMLERGTGRCWLEIVPRRNAATLEPIMINHLLPGTVVMSDAWGGYANVGTINNGVYVHEIVVHAHNFVDPLRADIHTQGIEGLWMQVKRKLRYQAGTSRELFQSYIAEFQWRYSHKEHTFGQYLDLLSENYNV